MRTILITGTVGAGKTSAAEEVGELLAAAGTPHGVIDLDALSRGWPPPSGDPFNFELTVRNLRSLAANFRDTGAELLVLAGVAENDGHRRKIAEAVGGELTVCRLRVDLATVRERLAGRHLDDREGLDWHLKRSGELDRILREAQVEDVVVDGSGPVTQVAAEILRTIG
ncbi:AAA family ATPase [Nonomuraea endophytica]|uniref:AAA family ATPase n=1 Tax=Nonomuraea endophytica TaxID=714136 RepID=UPI0037C9B2FB